ncbi:hypothetical protein QN277_024039 [Acacia crassicarpa]|uniref:Uncharacterized protein n=1 Tax=Acacia crassicarpa TaxID=499986 RepID=A0AAE1MMP2_9FABA|nr:hypothetical protein QN277_024039 [Acacia crassicarpa]
MRAQISPPGYPIWEAVRRNSADIEDLMIVMYASRLR